MRKVGRPTGLIDYDTDRNIARRQAGQKPQIRLIRTRTILYAGLIAIVGAIILFGLSSRATLEVNVLRDRTPPFVRLSDGSVRNAYTVKIINKANSAREFQISVAGPEGLVLSSIGETPAGNALAVTAEGDGLRSIRIFVTVPEPSLARAGKDITLTIAEAGGGERVDKTTAFMKDRR
jgi:polyferredoxin